MIQHLQTMMTVDRDDEEFARIEDAIAAMRAGEWLSSSMMRTGSRGPREGKTGPSENRSGQRSGSRPPSSIQTGKRLEEQGESGAA
jgi:hypothetical protein